MEEPISQWVLEQVDAVTGRFASPVTGAGLSFILFSRWFSWVTQVLMKICFMKVSLCLWSGPSILPPTPPDLPPCVHESREILCRLTEADSKTHAGSTQLRGMQQAYQTSKC